MQDVTNGNIRTLVVDDERPVADLMAEIVEGKNVSVTVKTDGVAAIDYLADHPMDIVITDLQMPGACGLDVLAKAKAVNPNVLVIIVTGHGSLESAIEAIRRGAYDYIRKPFKLTEIEVCFENARDKILLMRENKELLDQLKKAYGELMVLSEKNETCEKRNLKTENLTRIDFFSDRLKGYLQMDESALREGRLKRLETLAAMKKDGLLSDQEFQSMKNELFSR